MNRPTTWLPGQLALLVRVQVSYPHGHHRKGVGDRVEEMTEGAAVRLREALRWQGARVSWEIVEMPHAR